MEVVRTVEWMKEASAGLRQEGRRIGLVPTMGALHEGHLSLVRAAREQTEAVVVSIFVNPTQFGPQEDLQRYPRNLERDQQLLENERVDFLFAPPVEEMYPDGFTTYVTVQRLSEKLCGRSRPGHFRGVATVVLKLFEVVEPHVAFFGQKDAQQSVILRRMVRDLSLPVEIVVCPIVREPDGLALSSRNLLLSPEKRRAALVLSQSLASARQKIEAGERRAEPLLAEMRNLILRESRARVDYIEMVDLETLEAKLAVAGPTLIALAVWFGSTRLIDNMIVEEREGRIRYSL